MMGGRRGRSWGRCMEASCDGAERGWDDALRGSRRGDTAVLAGPRAEPSPIVCVWCARGVARVCVWLWACGVPRGRHGHEATVSRLRYSIHSLGERRVRPKNNTDRVIINKRRCSVDTCYRQNVSCLYTYTNTPYSKYSVIALQFDPRYALCANRIESICPSLTRHSHSLACV